MKDEVNLANELVAVVGTTTCIAGQTRCSISIKIKPDNVSTRYKITWLA